MCEQRVQVTNKTIVSLLVLNSSLNLIQQQLLPSISKVNTIDQLDVVEGLKELLLDDGFKLELLQSMSSDDLAEALCMINM